MQVKAKPPKASKKRNYKEIYASCVVNHAYVCKKQRKINEKMSQELARINAEHAARIALGNIILPAAADGDQMNDDDDEEDG